MPLYEYKCGEGHVTEKLVSITIPEEERDIQPCKECGRPADRIISQGSFVLKGKGWFKTGGY